MWRVVVYDQETAKNEEAKARYRAVESTTTTGCNARKTNTHMHGMNSTKKPEINASENAASFCFF
jgi:hypothetical protein